MLVGKENVVNKKIVKEVSEVFTIAFKNYNEIIDGSQTLYSPRILLVNLMDLGSYEEEVISALKEKFPKLKLIAIHCFQNPEMIDSLIRKGYDSYVSVFDLSNEFSTMLHDQEVV